VAALKLCQTVTSERRLPSRYDGSAMSGSTNENLADWVLALTGMRRSLITVKDWARYVEFDPEIKGGEPVVRGTRIGVRAIAARVMAGDNLDSLADDYPDVPRAALDTAVVFARSHPRRGRPARPWRV
jgi:uncharacterized protein (DUF433 family)